MSYDTWKARSPDDDNDEQPCKWIELPDGSAYCRHCGVQGEETCKWEQRK